MRPGCRERYKCRGAVNASGMCGGEGVEPFPPPSPAPDAGLPGEEQASAPCTFSLLAAVCHKGDITGGHYICYIKVRRGIVLHGLKVALL